MFTNLLLSAIQFKIYYRFPTLSNAETSAAYVKVKLSLPTIKTH
jgi:hypothetical protein